MKILPSDPPAAVPGRVMQGGPLGHFIRGGRLPVDPCTPLQQRVRGAFAYQPQKYRYGSATWRSDWRDAVYTGDTGPAKSATAATQRAAFGLSGDPPTPGSGPPGAPGSASLTASAPGTLIAACDDPTGGAGMVAVQCSGPLPFVGAAVVAWSDLWVVWQGGINVVDVSGIYALRYGALVAGVELAARYTAYFDSVPGPETVVRAVVV